jgi:hypothetical protein
LGSPRVDWWWWLGRRWPLGEQRKRGRGGAPTAARVSVKLEAGKINVRPWELEGDLGKGLGGFGRRRERAEM